MNKEMLYIAVSGIIAFILTVITSIYFNPWFNLFKNAFSDLGSDKANLPIIYNYGLIITSLFVIMYSISLISLGKNKLEVVSGSFFFIAGIFLSLIGIYHAGTRPHVFVSSYFFIQSDISILTWSLSALSNKINYGIISLTLVLLGTILGFFLNWPSVAIQEAFGISLISIWVILASFYYD